MSTPPKVGFLGLGIMGAQMAARLVHTGANVTVYNRSVAKTEPLRALGASVASTPAEVTRQCDLVFAMLADPKAACAVATDGNPMSADRVRWEHIQRVFELCDRNVSETARRLNMHRRTLQRILAKRAPR